ncbi:hypothetical protein DFH09DRAFT_1278922 [Mycena vulgaris]|nr:hypothetical protein DFH09DRAFT_1278922 [Mycena vulgaris]
MSRQPPLAFLFRSIATFGSARGPSVISTPSPPGLANLLRLARIAPWHRLVTVDLFQVGTGQCYRERRRRQVELLRTVSPGKESQTDRIVNSAIYAFAQLISPVSPPTIISGFGGRRCADPETNMGSGLATSLFPRTDHEGKKISCGNDWNNRSLIWQMAPNVISDLGFSPLHDLPYLQKWCQKLYGQSWIVFNTESNECNLYFRKSEHFFWRRDGRGLSKFTSPKSHLAPSAKNATSDPSRFANRDKRSHVLGERGTTFSNHLKCSTRSLRVQASPHRASQQSPNSKTGDLPDWETYILWSPAIRDPAFDRRSRDSATSEIEKSWNLAQIVSDAPKSGDPCPSQPLHSETSTKKRKRMVDNGTRQVSRNTNTEDEMN